MMLPCRTAASSADKIVEPFSNFISGCAEIIKKPVAPQLLFIYEFIPQAIAVDAAFCGLIF